MSNPRLSSDGTLTEKYFRMAAWEHWLSERSVESRVLTITGCTIELLFDFQKDRDGQNSELKPVHWFEETVAGLVTIQNPFWSM